MTPHLGFGLDGVHIEGTLLYLECIGTRKKGGGEENMGCGSRRGRRMWRRWWGKEKGRWRTNCSRT